MIGRPRCSCCSLCCSSSSCPRRGTSSAGSRCVALGVFEVGYWQRRVRRKKVQTGVENLVGATGEVTERLAPSGQIRVLGELWQARSSSELPPGSRVRVVAVDGLMLEVEARRGVVPQRQPTPMNHSLG